MNETLGTAVFSTHQMKLTCLCTDTCPHSLLHFDVTFIAIHNKGIEQHTVCQGPYQMHRIMQGRAILGETVRYLEISLYCSFKHARFLPYSESVRILKHKLNGLMASLVASNLPIRWIQSLKNKCDNENSWRDEYLRSLERLSPRPGHFHLKYHYNHAHARAHLLWK